MFTVLSRVLSVAMVALVVTGTLSAPKGPPGRSVKKTVRLLRKRYLSWASGWAAK